MRRIRRFICGLWKHREVETWWGPWERDAVGRWLHRQVYTVCSWCGQTVAERTEYPTAGWE